MKEEEYLRIYGMSKEEYIKQNYNVVNNLTAVCRTNMSWPGEEYPELEIGKTYQVSLIGVYRSSTEIMLTEFDDNRYNAGCFDIYENGKFIDNYRYTKDPRFWAPYLRKMLKERSFFGYERDLVNNSIPAHLTNIEQEYNVKILLAVESGSRAWGLESPKSDWDVRLIYVHQPEWYSRVEEPHDVIEHYYEDGVDLIGWELRKALALFIGCNPSFMEWLNSPRVYYVNEDFAKRIHEVEKDFFNPIKMMYYYNQIYNKYNERYLQHEGYHMKYFLYYLRGILACKWIEKYNSLPPMPFNELVDATVDDYEIKAKIHELIRIKKSGKEHDMLVVDNILVEYARKWADYYNERVGSLRPEQDNVSIETLDSILYDMVKVKKNNELK